MAVLACTCQVFKCLIKGRFWGWKSFISTGAGSLAAEGRLVGTGGHCCHFHAAHGPHPTLHQQCSPSLSSTAAFCCAIVFYVLPKGKEMGLVMWLLDLGHLIGEIIKGFAFTTCQRLLLQTMTLIAVHFWHCLQLARLLFLSALLFLQVYKLCSEK